ncbi:hypothetical protein F5Y08DRAFT_321529 [Xylaria arbuscula]|nr:hypothetical protein F5Y08DRAFT_321529 [Xylaria arbuscula]
MPRNAFNRTLQRKRHRICWIRFSLPPDQVWPTWPTQYPDKYRGPLTGASGCQQVLLGRQIDNPETAVFITLWESDEALETFRQTSASGELLRGLGHEDGSVVKLRYCASGTLEYSFHGPVTLNIFTIPYTDIADYDAWRDTICGAFGGFVPTRVINHPPIFRVSHCYWVDEQQEVQSMTEEVRQKQASFYQFYCWDLLNPWYDDDASTREEEFSANDPESYAKWTERVTKASPPVEGWVQERWHITPEPYEEESLDEEEYAEQIKILDKMIRDHRGKGWRNPSATRGM